MNISEGHGELQPAAHDSKLLSIVDFGGFAVPGWQHDFRVLLRVSIIEHD